MLSRRAFCVEWIQIAGRNRTSMQKTNPHGRNKAHMYKNTRQWVPENDNLQLDWPSETDTLKINLPRDWEGYDRFEYTDEKLSTRRIHWYGEPSSVFIFWRVNLKKSDEKHQTKLGSPHHWINPVESSSIGVSGAPERPQSRGKLFFCALATYFDRYTS